MGVNFTMKGRWKGDGRQVLARNTDFVPFSAPYMGYPIKGHVFSQPISALEKKTLTPLQGQVVFLGIPYRLFTK